MVKGGMVMTELPLSSRKFSEEKKKEEAPKPEKKRSKLGIMFKLVIIVMFVSGAMNVAAYKYLEKKDTTIANIQQDFHAFRLQHTQDKDANRVIIAKYIKVNHQKVSREVAASIATNVLSLSEKWAIPYELVVAMIEIESGFDPQAVSSKGARGLLQVMPGIWVKTFNMANQYELHEIDGGIEAGIKIMKRFLDGSDGCPRGDLMQALYLYVGKDKAYAGKVLTAMAEFILFRASE